MTLEEIDTLRGVAGCWDGGGRLVANDTIEGFLTVTAGAAKWGGKMPKIAMKFDMGINTVAYPVRRGSTTMRVPPGCGFVTEIGLPREVTGSIAFPADIVIGLLKR